MIRCLALFPVILICLAAVPAVRPVVGSAAAAPESIGEGRIPSDAEFAELVQRDPIAVLDASLARYKRDIRGYHCILQKQECLGRRLGKVEVIRHAVREEPFAVYMFWEQGAGSAAATLYVRGENGGRMRVKTTYFVEANPDPNGPIARSSSRYSIEDAGIYNGTLRTYRAWKAARDQGHWHVEYLGRQTIPELGRECYVLKRTCNPPDIDNFRMADTERRDPAQHPLEAFTTITIYLDCETWLQTGSVLTKADGSLMGAYYFREVKINPAFEADQFRPAILHK
jgi:hypothetical protein